MFRIADGEPLGSWPDGTTGDPRPRGHSIEFRINAEDPGRGFLPAPGTVTTWQPPSGPGVRLDAGVQAGSVIGPAWDSLLGKLIVTGATRQQALQRAARALAEFEVSGLATALPFHRAVVTDPAFAPELYGSAGPFTVHTRWIETEFRNDLPSWNAGEDGTAGPAGPADRQTVVVEVDGKRLEVTLPATLAVGAATPPAQGGQPRRQRGSRQPGSGGASGNVLAAPMQGTVIKVAVTEGQQVAAGDLILVLEAMKMEQPVNAHRSGTVASLTAQAGATITSGAAICEITDLRRRSSRARVRASRAPFIPIGWPRAIAPSDNWDADPAVMLPPDTADRGPRSVGYDGWPRCRPSVQRQPGSSPQASAMAPTPGIAWDRAPRSTAAAASMPFSPVRHIRSAMSPVTMGLENEVPLHCAMPWK
jgi:acetyl/propionyl-CoA carboxylase alpha subunit